MLPSAWQVICFLDSVGKRKYGEKDDGGMNMVKENEWDVKAIERRQNK